MEELWLQVTIAGIAYLWLCGGFVINLLLDIENKKLVAFAWPFIPIWTFVLFLTASQSEFDEHSGS
ncbi:MAG: hypothetical protein GY739_05310 [Mesoflavibacter sp.]|nr:hypothetical protein [Mesoflavibacter sp.]